MGVGDEQDVGGGKAGSVIAGSRNAAAFGQPG